MRSKARTLSGPVNDPSKLPKWNYDGSSTGQSPGVDSEVILFPQAAFKDPFRRGKNMLVMCDAYTAAGEPIPTNKRHNAAKIFSYPDVVAEEPWNTPCCRKMCNGHLDGLLVVFLGPRVHTIVVLMLTRISDVTLLTLISKPVFMRTLTLLELMQK
ncbi:hypothetical protein GLYMA_02G243901v4 [Glycine max]|nr:hypothetical protein GLYMA_02G243901v4 [Glycine max]KAH1061894.1 hypothetical protein GYH30_005075 [Glycine max]